MAYSYNKVTLVGNLGRDAEVKYTPSGKSIINFSVATTRSWKDQQSGEWKKETNWSNVVGWSMERLAPMLTKGSAVSVEIPPQNALSGVVVLQVREGVVGQVRRDERPEARAVPEHPQVRELVDDHGLERFRRSEDQPPAVADDAVDGLDVAAVPVEAEGGGGVKPPPQFCRIGSSIHLVDGSHSRCSGPRADSPQWVDCKAVVRVSLPSFVMTQRTIWIGLPAYNEEATIPALFPRFREVFLNKSAAYRIVLYNDGCTDRTVERTLGTVTRVADTKSPYFNRWFAVLHRGKEIKSDPLMSLRDAKAWLEVIERMNR